MEFSEEELKQIFKIFKDETEEHLNNVSKALLELEKKPDDKEVSATLYRDLHSLKGAVRMVGFSNLQMIAHKIEDIFDAVNKNNIMLDKVLENQEIIINNQKEILNKLGNIIDYQA